MDQGEAKKLWDLEKNQKASRRRKDKKIWGKKEERKKALMVASFKGPV